MMRVSISINGLRLVGHFDALLEYHINGYHLRNDMQRRFEWDNSTWDCIDHQLFSQHFRSLTPDQQIPRMKFVHDQQPVRVRLARYETVTDATSDKCPCCKVTPETQTHLLQCTQNPTQSEALRAFNKALHADSLHAVYYLLVFSKGSPTASFLSPSTGTFVGIRPTCTLQSPTFYRIKLVLAGLPELMDFLAITGLHWPACRWTPLQIPILQVAASAFVFL